MWLSGFDSRLTGEGDWQDITRRALRCGLTLLIIEAAFYGLWRCWVTGDRSAGLIYLATIAPLIILWGGCISEAGARYFLHLIDPHDKRPYDPKAAVRELDAVGHLIRSGRKEEAIQLCRTLLQTSPEHHAALETTLHHLGAPPLESPKQLSPLAEASRLRKAGKFEEAKILLTVLLERHPANVEAALMLIRLYAQDLRQPAMARDVLRVLENQPHVSTAYIEIARHSITHQQPPADNTSSAEEPLPESIEELLAKKYFGTAVDLLEKQCEAEPANFETWIKLAEVHGLHCANIKLAEKTIRQIEANPAFNPGQKQQARNHLNDWREARNRTA
jgi:tetratricopeptide (TPR) repeat protein